MIVTKNNHIYVENELDLKDLKFCENLNNATLNIEFVITKNNEQFFKDNADILKNVKNIHFSYFDYSYVLKYFPNLEKLSFDNCFKIVIDENFVLENVTDFTLSNIENVNVLEHMPNLEHLTIINPESNLCTIEPSIDYCKYINNLTNLKELTIERQANITFLDLTNLKELNKLSIVGNYYLQNLKLNKNLKVKEFSLFDNYGLNEFSIVKQFVQNKIFKKSELEKLNISLFMFDKLQEVFNVELRNNTNRYMYEKVIRYSQLVNRWILENNCSYNEMLVINEHANEMISQLNLLKCKSDYEKFLQIYVYLIKNTQYDNVRYARVQECCDYFNTKSVSSGIYRKTIGKGIICNNVIGAFNKRECVCEGFSYSLKYLLDKVNIKCEPVFAYVGMKGGKGDFECQVATNHVLNKVYIGDKVVYCDGTFDQKRYNEYVPRIEISYADESTQEFLNLLNDDNKDRELILKSVYYPLSDMFDCKTIVGEKFLEEEYKKTEDDLDILLNLNEDLLLNKEKECKEYILDEEFYKKKRNLNLAKLKEKGF